MSSDDRAATLAQVRELIARLRTEKAGGITVFEFRGHNRDIVIEGTHVVNESGAPVGVLKQGENSTLERAAIRDTLVENRQPPDLMSALQAMETALAAPEPDRKTVAWAYDQVKQLAPAVLPALDLVARFLGPR